MMRTKQNAMVIIIEDKYGPYFPGYGDGEFDIWTGKDTGPALRLDASKAACFAVLEVKYGIISH